MKGIKKINDYLWEMPGDIVPARIYTTEKMLAEISRDRSLQQIVNMTSLPGIQKYALAMPDCHEGYGFPIGGVAATLFPDGFISPGGIGYDINCGVRLLKSNLSAKDIAGQIEALADNFYQDIPSGVGRGGALKLSDKEFARVLDAGAKWAVKNGYGEQADLLQIESAGSLAEADHEKVSPRAKDRGRDQLGTLGAGNHFVEIDRVEEIYRPDFGFFPGQVVIQIHTGSRGLGHQVATDYIQRMLKAMAKYNISLPDRELAGAPFSSPEGQAYFSAMAAAANFAWANRQLITHEVRGAWQKVLGGAGGRLELLYDVAHNIAKIEEYDGKKMIVHRKGATRAFPGQPVIIPGSMGTASYVLIGTQASLEKSFGSTCHGAGRRLSRHAALRAVNAGELAKELESAGIHIKAGSRKGLAEEAPLAYKDVSAVVDVVDGAGLAKKVAKLRPLAVIKG